MEEDKKTSPLLDYYSQPYQGKRYRENSGTSVVIPLLIKIIAWIALIVGVICIFADIEHDSWIYGLATSISSIFMFGFSAVVKAAYRYLDE